MRTRQTGQAALPPSTKLTVDSSRIGRTGHVMAQVHIGSYRRRALPRGLRVVSIGARELHGLMNNPPERVVIDVRARRGRGIDPLDARVVAGQSIERLDACANAAGFTGRTLPSGAGADSYSFAAASSTVSTASGDAASLSFAMEFPLRSDKP